MKSAVRLLTNKQGSKQTKAPAVEQMCEVYLKRLLTPADVLGPVLRGGEPLQDAAHLLGEDHRDVQGQEAPRGAAAHLLHHRQRLQEHDARCV